MLKTKKIIFTIAALMLMLTIIGCSIEMGISASDADYTSKSTAGISISIQPGAEGSRRVSSEAFSVKTLTVIITDAADADAGSVYWVSGEGEKLISFYPDADKDYTIKIIQSGEEKGEKKTVTESSSLYLSESDVVNLIIVPGYALIIVN